jgi:hypothetical protein
MGDMDPWRLLDPREQAWRPLLESVSLAAELDVDPGESRAALVSLGKIYRWNKDARANERTRLLARRPACLVVGMSSVAATDYEEGTYYQKLWDSVEYDGSPKDQGAWGQAFLDALDKLRLPRFPRATLRFVGPILMHSGVPTYCLKDLLHMLVDHERRDPGLDAASFIQWATGGSSRMNTLDKPVQRLIEDGGKYAYDIIDRLIDLLDRLREPRPDLFGVGLPERLITETRRVKDQGLLGAINGPRRSAQQSRAGRPRLALDPFGEGPRVLLPTARDPWRVVVDGQPYDIDASPGWLGEELTETSFPLAHPACHVQARLVGRTETTAISVVRDDDQLLVFSEDGEFLPPGRPLPPDVVWVLYPEDQELRCEGKLHEISEALLPFGWYGWTLLEVDLSKARSLRLASGSTRDVRGSAGPRLRLPEPLPGVTSSRRQPVYGVAPLISLPADQPRNWYIEVRAADEYSAMEPVRLTERSDDIDPWEHLPRPVVGSFEITILGPLGFRFHRRIAIAEGLSVSYEPDVRLFTDDGLDPAIATFAGEAELSDTKLVFGPHEQARAFSYGAEKFVIETPHLSVLHDNQAGGARWSSAPLSLSAESLSVGTAGTLLVRAPAEVILPSLQAVAADVTQDVRHRGLRHPGQARFPLAQITDTVEAFHRLDLCLRIDGRSVPVAFVRPRGLATGAVRRGYQIQLADCTAQPGLHAGIYVVFEPWRQAVVLQVDREGTITLPPFLREVGPLRVLPAAQGPRGSWPYWPSAADSFLVPSPLPVDTARSPLRAFVAGSGPLPSSSSPERIWLLVKLADQLVADGAREDLRTQCDMRLRSYPVPALLALAGTSLNTAEAVIQVIRTGLAGQQVVDSIELATARQMWGRLRSVAALLSGGILTDPEQMCELAELVEQDHGAAVAALLSGESDPYEPSDDSGGQARPQAEQLVGDAIALLSASPYRELTPRIHARPEGIAQVSASLALAMRAAAKTGSHRGFPRKYRANWVDLATAQPDLVSLDIIAAQAAIAAIDRRSRLGE